MRVALIWLLAVGCVEVEQDVPSEAWSDEIMGGRGTSTYIAVFVVDDRAAASDLRSAIAEQTARSFALLRDVPNDPAEWRPVDWQVIVALPSRQGSARFVGPNQVPALAQIWDDGPPDVEATVAAAVADELASLTAGDDAPFRPLETISDLSALLTGARPPVDDRESAFSSSLVNVKSSLVHVVLAASTDDDSPLPVDDYGLSEIERFKPLYSVVASVPGADQTACFGDTSTAPTTRIEAWMLSMEKVTFNLPCASWDFAKDGLFSIPQIDRLTGAMCTSQPIAESPDGEPACRVLAYLGDPDAPCDPARGWRDPLENGAPAVDPWGDLRRVCEVQPLEGADLAACQTSTPCEGCGSGWCRYKAGSEVSSELDEFCDVGGYPSRLRFVGGAHAGARAFFRVMCELEPLD
ncbi:MAG: hypothetical protein HOW73_41335 [Polyangiaceae bacterium]|nr:hypothetical protein [Polyangiaceae bacterium]